MTSASDEPLSRLAKLSRHLFLEAHYLDTRQWEKWLALFAPDCEFWVPAWTDAGELTEDPQSQMSLIYYAGKAGIEDRIWRIKSGTSIASRVLPRTHHQISNILLDDDDGNDGLMLARYQWCVHRFDPKRKVSDTLFGRGEATLAADEDGLRYLRKKIILLNDYIPTHLDIISI